LIPFFFKYEILFDLIPPIANQGIFKSFVSVLIFSIPIGFLFFFVAVSNTGKLIFYDFGMMGNILPNLQTRLAAMVKAAALRDASSLVSQLQQAGLISKDIDVGPVRRLVRLMIKEAITPPFSPNIIEKLSGDLYDLVYDTPFQLPEDLIFVMQ